MNSRFILLGSKPTLTSAHGGGVRGASFRTFVSVRGPLWSDVSDLGGGGIRHCRSQSARRRRQNVRSRRKRPGNRQQRLRIQPLGPTMRRKIARLTLAIPNWAAWARTRAASLQDRSIINEPASLPAEVFGRNESTSYAPDTETAAKAECNCKFCRAPS